jgi:hypothetical protein
MLAPLTRMRCARSACGFGHWPAACPACGPLPTSCLGAPGSRATSGSDESADPGNLKGGQREGACCFQQPLPPHACGSRLLFRAAAAPAARCRRRCSTPWPRQARPLLRKGVQQGWAFIAGPSLPMPRCLGSELRHGACPWAAAALIQEKPPLADSEARRRDPSSRPAERGPLPMIGCLRAPGFRATHDSDESADPGNLWEERASGRA